MKTLANPTPIRFSGRTIRKIARISRMLGLSRADTMRLALETGLPIVERIPRLIEAETAKTLTGSK